MARAPCLVALLLAFAAVPGLAGDRDLVAPSASVAPIEGRQVALVVGNGAYQHAGRLEQAPRDARLVAETLSGLGYQVKALYDLDRAALDRAAVDFRKDLAGAAVGFFYYAGHGVQVGGANYLVPVDAQIESEDYVSSAAVDIGRVLASMEASKARLNVVVLDACRNNPFAGTWSAGGRSVTTSGLAGVERAPRGTIIAYATAPGRVAADEGIYAKALATGLKVPGAEITEVFRQVYADVSARSRSGQEPWYTESRTPGSYFPAGMVADGSSRLPSTSQPIRASPIEQDAGATAGGRTVVFQAAEAGTLLEVRCLGGGGGPSARVELRGVSDGNCRVTGRTGSTTLVTLVTVKASQIFFCFADGERSCGPGDLFDPWEK